MPIAYTPMNLQQLRCLCAVVDEGFNISRAARTLHASQPGVSRQVRLLEEELKVEILSRRDGRISGLTPPGVSVLDYAREMLRCADNLRRVGEDFANQASGQLVSAITHVHARYILPQVATEFRRRYPGVRLVLRKGTPEQILELVTSGEADLGISNRIARDPGSPLVVELACGDLPRSVVVQRDHPLTRLSRLTLEEVARYPLIALEPTSSSGRAVTSAFEAAGIQPNIVMQAIDPDVAKACVVSGVGIAVIPAVSVEPSRDSTLAALDAAHLFGSGDTTLMIDPRSYLRAYTYDFIHMISPAWPREQVEAELRRCRSAGD